MAGLGALPAYAPELGPCWPWQGALNGAGYGYVRIGYEHVEAHRAMYEHVVGPIPAGLEIDHLCRVVACVRPDHLEPVTRAENQRRGWAARPTRRP